MKTTRLTRDDLFRLVANYITDRDFLRELKLKEKPALSFLAQGEYNINFLLVSGQKRLVLRVNTGSQMGLDNQIKYEYQALQSLKNSGVTPRPIYLDDTKEKLPLGLLVMEYLPGRALQYEKDLTRAAKTLACVHRVPVSADSQLMATNKPLSDIWEECNQLIQVYLDSPLGKKEIKKILLIIRERMQEIKSLEDSIMGILPVSIVNTEVNSGNFIVNEQREVTYLVDWEKPLLTTPLQDLSHFLVPTTTLWKTNYLFSEGDKDSFIRTYFAERGLTNLLDDAREALQVFDKFSLMRGISWSAMAWVDYQKPGRILKNRDTFNKIESYLTEEFLKGIFSEILR